MPPWLTARRHSWRCFSPCGGVFKEERASNMLDGGAHFYGTYETGDGKYISLGSIEPQFYALLIEKAGLDHEFAPQMNQNE